MNLIEYIQLAFVFCGAILMVIVAFKLVLAQTRKIRLYNMAMPLLDLERPLPDNNNEIRNEQRRRRTSRRLRAEIPPHEIQAFLSQVSTSDISNDVFLKEVVEELVTRNFPDQEETIIR